MPDVLRVQACQELQKALTASEAKEAELQRAYEQLQVLKFSLDNRRVSGPSVLASC